MIPSYSSPFNLGHKAAEEFFDGNQYIVQEKIDGSQFSFGVYELSYGRTELRCRSHNAQIDLENPGMFEKAVETVRRLDEDGVLQLDWTYRSEFLQKPKHNTLSYGRVPNGNIILFDIDAGDQDYLNYATVKYEAISLELECVPVLDVLSVPPDKERIQEWFSRTSILGNTPIEGVVLKSYRKYDQHKKILMVKIVSEAFKETHNKDWKDRNPTRSDVIDKIIGEFGSEVRWQKVVQHLDEAGELINAPEDIGKLLKELAEDFEVECSSEIKDILWNHFRKDIVRGIQRGFPEWYKQKCMGE